MAEDNIMTPTDDTARNKCDGEMSPVEKVFSTYEFLECIFLKLDSPDIPPMSMVNKACYDINLTTSVIQYLMSSNNYFCHKTFGDGLCRILPEHLFSQKLREPRLFILCRGGKETIMVISRSEPRPARSEPVFLTDNEDIPGLTPRARALLD
jgi:hypothetical protein